MKPIVDPRAGDVEDDSSSTKRRSVLAIAGNLLAEISVAKLVTAWLFLVLLPAALLGLVPLVASGWLATLSSKITAPLGGLWSAFLLLLVVALGWLGGRPLFRAAEQSFWSLNALAVQPGYALCREVLGHLGEYALTQEKSPERLSHLRAATAAGAGIMICGAALWVAAMAWPASRWIGEPADLMSPLNLIIPAFANALVLVSSYLATVALVWGLSDAAMDQPRNLAHFDMHALHNRVWRVAHLSDVHIVGERYGFRIESGRAGPRGNAKLLQLLAQLDTIHARKPLDIILITGDVTDAGRSPEWAEFLDVMGRHPELSKRTLVLPGNHDVNIVDRANPARLDLPTSPSKHLRQVRALSAIDALQGDRVRVVDLATGQLGCTLSESLARHRSAIAAFADTGTLRLSIGLAQIWNDVFPMVLLPDTEEGLGVILLNSNPEAHFSFTNALGLISAEQARALASVTRRFSRARWIVALHHHVVEYPKPAKALSERIGTALINGTWFVRQLETLRHRGIVMHGHRHIDWVGQCGNVRIISAPSPIMEATEDKPTYFYIHTLGAGEQGRLSLLTPERIEVPASVADDARGAINEDS